MRKSHAVVHMNGPQIEAHDTMHMIDNILQAPGWSRSGPEPVRNPCDGHSGPSGVVLTGNSAHPAVEEHHG